VTGNAAARGDTYGMNTGLDTTVDQIAAGVYRFSTWIPDITDRGFTFNQFLLTGEEPFLFHCGQRFLFDQVSAAIARVIPMETLRWISFGHVEADECGAMNLLLDAATNAEVVHGPLACSLSLTDLCDRPPVAVADEPLDTGGHAFGTSPPRTSHTTGRPDCGSTRQRRHSWPATCSRTSVSAKP